MLRAGDPGNYWAGIHLDLVRSADGLPLTLVMMSDSITGGGLFFELWPWIALLFAGLMLSALIWLPFVRGITSSIGVLNEAAGRIAHGKFDERIERHRSDELGELSTSVNAMAAQLGDYVAQQRRITADVAHELCSPIARMQMALGVIEQRSTPDQKTYLDKIDRELQHMAKLVEEVLSFSKAETLPDRVKPEDIDLSELVETVVQREASGHDVLVDVPPHLQIHTIREALDRAMGNVLRNAVRYAGQAGLIRLSASRDESGKVIIGISDEGPGVPAEALGRLFDAFYRPEVARTRGTGGSGLGLAIVKRCIEACGGNVRALNREPHGLEVVMEIPVSS